MQQSAPLLRSDTSAFLNDSTTLAGRLTIHAIEMLHGHATGELLRPWLTPPVLRALTERRRLSGGVQSGRRQRIRIVRTRSFAPAPGVVEVAIVVAVGRRSHAAAVRMELQRGKWRMSALELV